MWHRKCCVAISSQLFLFCLEEKTACLEPKSLFQFHCYFCCKWRIWIGRWNILCDITPEIYLQSLWEDYLCMLTVTNLATLRNWSLYVQNVIVCICDLCVCVRACVICIKGFLYPGVTLCGCLFSRLFEGNFYLYLQDIKVREGLWKVTVTRSFETSGSTFPAMQRQFAQYRNSRLHQCENSKLELFQQSLNMNLHFLSVWPYLRRRECLSKKLDFP
jgi:hypothetical protein